MPLFLFSCSCLVLTGFYAPRILAPWVIMRRLVRRENLFPRMATDGSPRCLLQLLGNAGRELTAMEHRGVSFSISRGFGCITTLDIGIVLLIARL